MKLVGTECRALDSRFQDSRASIFDPNRDELELERSGRAETNLHIFVRSQQNQLSIGVHSADTFDTAIYRLFFRCSTDYFE